jgi:hypothetical protein
MYSLSIVGRREVVVKSTGDTDVQHRELFSGLPEPSFDQMDEILSAKVPVKAYVDWLRNEAKYYTYSNGSCKNGRTCENKSNPREELANEIEREASIHMFNGWDLFFNY